MANYSKTEFQSNIGFFEWHLNSHGEFFRWSLNTTFNFLIPIVVFYVIVTGLPMFIVLRRFSILMTMIGEKILLGTKPSVAVQLTVYSMILGSIIASINDLSFDLIGYLFVLANDFFTAANGVYTKQKLEAKEFGINGLLFYNALFMLPVSAIYCVANGDFDKALTYNGWNNPFFVLQFLVTCGMGFVLNFSVNLCTKFNSALTTTIIGCLKNILVTYLGMLIGGDYIFSVYNFIGLNISIIGSIVYSWITFRRKEPEKSHPSKSDKQALLASEENV